MPCRFVDNEHSTVCKVSLSSFDRIPQHVLTGGLAVGVGGGSKHRILSMRKAEIEPFGLRSHGDTVHQVTYRSIGASSSWAFGRQPRPAGTLRVSPNPEFKVRSESGIPPGRQLLRQLGEGRVLAFASTGCGSSRVRPSAPVHDFPDLGDVERPAAIAWTPLLGAHIAPGRLPVRTRHSNFIQRWRWSDASLERV